MGGTSDYGSDWEHEWDADTLEAAFSLSGSAQHVRHASTSAVLPAPAAAPPNESDSDVDNSDTANPMTRFRRRAWLSVTDWSSPAWCEVQTMYRLEAKQAQRKLPPDQQLEQFASKDGNVIRVDQDKKKARDGVLQRGKDVHADLEKKVMGDMQTVDVKASSREEAWALRLLNTILGLAILRASGTTRELPVIGLVNGVLTFGVIDQVEKREFKHREPVYTLKSKGKKPASKTGDEGDGKKQKTLDSWFSSPTKQASPVKVKQKEQTPTPVDETRYGYVVSDSKTRYRKRMPAAGQTKGSRMQLMLYRRLLEQMVSPDAEKATDWPMIFLAKKVDPSAAFSDEFLASVMPILDNISPIVPIGIPSSLQDLLNILPFIVEYPIEHRLEIVYYLRDRVRRSPPVTRNRVSTANKRQRTRSPSVTDFQEDELVLQEIILEDLRRQQEQPVTTVEALPASLPVEDGRATPIVIEEDNQESQFELVTADDSVTPTAATEAPVVAAAEPEQTPSDERFHEVGTKIGVESFRYNAVVLDKWTAKMVDLWQGKRPAEGVDVNETYKCRSCEFEATCEWRAAKAQEARASVVT